MSQQPKGILTRACPTQADEQLVPSTAFMNVDGLTPDQLRLVRDIVEAFRASTRPPLPVAPADASLVRTAPPAARQVHPELEHIRIEAEIAEMAGDMERARELSRLLTKRARELAGESAT